MPESQTSSQPTANEVPTGSFLDQFRELWKVNQVWRDRLAKSASHAALDIPEDDMNIQGGDKITINEGLGAKGLIALAAAIGVPYLAAAALGYSLLKKPDPPAVQPTQHTTDTDTRYRIKALPGG